MRLLFIGISGYQYPHVRIRCYRFCEQLKLHGIDAEVLSFKDHLAPNLTEAQMYGLGDRQKLTLSVKSLPALLKKRNTVFYLQKAHYHAAMPLLLAKYFKSKYILDYDDYEIGKDQYGSDLFCGFKRPLLNRIFYGESGDLDITRRAAQNAVACIASSHALIDFLSPLNPKTFYLPTGVDCNRFHPAEVSSRSPGDPFVLMWSGIVWGESIAENLRFAIQAISLLKDRRLGIRLKIIGTGDFLPSVLDFARSRLPSNMIEHHAWVHPDEMPAHLRSAHAGLLPLVAESQWNRAKSPTKLFEYLASGLPVIGSPNGEIMHVIDDGANGRLASDVDSFAQAIERMAANSEEWRIMAANARQTALSRYDIRILGDRLTEILTKLNLDL